MAKPPSPDAAAPAERGRTAPRGWSSRLAWGVLVGCGVIVAARVVFATAVRVHGDGMAPTLVDGDHVLLLRGTWSVDRGDVVVYAARLHAPAPAASERRSSDGPRSRSDDGREFPDARRAPQGELRNTAVVDPEELGEALDENWRTVQARADAGLASRTTYRVGRVLARPGDRVVLSLERDGVGITVEGQRVEQKEGTPVRLQLEDDTAPRQRRALWEQAGDRRYLVLDAGDRAPRWAALLPEGATLGEAIAAPGYLVLADNRDEGRCCDSRALGWIEPDAIRGEVLARLAGDTTALPELEPGSRGLQWKP